MSKCTYIVEGECEKKLITALKLNPKKLIDGKIIVRNLINKHLTKTFLSKIRPESTVVLVFDTDVERTEILKNNIESIKNHTNHVQIIYLPQVLNLEDELVRCTDVKKITELTQSTGIHNFKNDFNHLKDYECRNMLDKHALNVGLLWKEETPKAFGFLPKNSEIVKINR